MRRLWFGGSFNPVHNGHLISARAAAESGGFDRVVLVPSAQPPHKAQDTDLASPSARLVMCQHAISGDHVFEINDLELDRAGPSYTIDTVRQLQKRGHDEIFWLIGADMANSLPTWHRPAELLAETKFVLMRRPGFEIDWKLHPNAFRHLEHNVVPAPLLDISSTQIRQRIAAGLSIRYLTPQPVIDYIEQHQLYRHR